jgi:hypothetical protein
MGFAIADWQHAPPRMTRAISIHMLTLGDRRPWLFSEEKTLALPVSVTTGVETVSARFAPRFAIQ